jgi:Transposase DDE domain
LNQLWGDLQGKMHPYRLESLMTAVQALFRGGRLTLTSLGRSVQGDAKVKNKIKRIDRLVGNRKLHAQRRLVYAAIARCLIGEQSRPIIIVDWTGVANDAAWYLLRASVPFAGRALTLYEKVVAKHQYDKRSIRTEFLAHLAQIVGSTARPIIVTDAGFRASWYRAVEKQGWQWVGRLRGRTKIQLEHDGPWVSYKDLFDRATSVAELLPSVRIVKSDATQCSLVIYKAKRRGRVRVTRRTKKPSQWWLSRYYARYHAEPWLLVTCIDDLSAQQIVSVYKNRMSIEEGFRDLKCPRFGWGFELARSKRLFRIENLLLIGALASITVWICGYAASRAGKVGQLQANTERRRRVLSHHFVGAWLLSPKNTTPLALPIGEAISCFATLAFSVANTKG